VNAKLAETTRQSRKLVSKTKALLSKHGREDFAAKHRSTETAVSQTIDYGVTLVSSGSGEQS
jgi:hypothetical protein